MELTIPKHVAIIMDGNGRWAKEKGKIRLEGHRQGAVNLEKIIEHSLKIGVKYLTVYAFSTENWKRPEKEVNGLMELFSKYLDGKKKNLKKQGIKLFVTGSEENISEKLMKKIKETEKYLENCENMVFNIAFNYGGRKEITDAVNKILETDKKRITETEFREYLYRPEIPDPELVIRTSGEFRVSNFLLWETAYSEFYITDVYWPDFTTEEYDRAIMSFNGRDRRYGGLNAK
ncbi:MAG: polyprenyl diphosphate synthase [Leptotrichiaceae bacterium]|nr:polyprenyl diphosphate synthase [Leptotrichiaceae bacterium]